jgi:hypothetical protein
LRLANTPASDAGSARRYTWNECLIAWLTHFDSSLRLDGQKEKAYNENYTQISNSIFLYSNVLYTIALSNLFQANDVELLANADFTIFPRCTTFCSKWLEDDTCSSMRIIVVSIEGVSGKGELALASIPVTLM